MIAKEWRDARWKLIVMALLVVVTLVSGRLLTPYGQIVKTAEENEKWQIQNTTPDKEPSPGKSTVSPDTGKEPGESLSNVDLPTGPVEIALREMWIIYGNGGGAAMALLAGLLGVGLVSEEVRRNTILLLLSRPVSRRVLLLTKYLVCAGVLLLAAVSGGIILILAAGIKGYPLSELSVPGFMLSVLLLWMGSLFVLGVALISSIVFGNVLGSIVATLAALVLLSPDQWTTFSFWSQFPIQVLYTHIPEDLTIFSFWTSASLYFGEGTALTNFLVCLITAAIPLLIALWLFDRKAY